MVNNDREITQREAEINDIAKSIFQLADIFKELQTLVVDQGTMLDRIDYNIDQTVVQMKEGHRELTVVMTFHFLFH
jgi:syntaxin 16